jgi:NAD(P)-dependent dehydrogenase (short-subunit alcohol dehydrogenase family)
LGQILIEALPSVAEISGDLYTVNMTRGILIAGNLSSLSTAIEIEIAKRVEHFALALIPNRLPGSANPAAGAPPSSGQEARIPLVWNPGSPISARTLVIAAENRLEHINEAILICAPPSVRRAAADLAPGDIEIMVNDHIKGWFYLVKELTAVFRARRAGSLVLVFSETGPGGGKDDTADILGPAVLASFRAFTQSVLASALNEPYQTMAFSSSEAGAEAAFAAFIVKQLDEGGKRSNGKWHKFGKLNLFGRL